MYGMVWGIWGLAHHLIIDMGVPTLMPSVYATPDSENYTWASRRPPPSSHHHLPCSTFLPYSSNPGRHEAHLSTSQGHPLAAALHHAIIIIIVRSSLQHNIIITYPLIIIML